MRLIDLDEFLRQNCIDRIEGKSCEECKHHVLEVSCERLMEQPTAEVTLCHLDSPCEYQNANIAMPTAEKVKRGRWVKLDMHPHLADHKCTACGESAYVPTCMGEPMYLFCPNCGARMEEVEG